MHLKIACWPFLTFNVPIALHLPLLISSLHLLSLIYLLSAALNVSDFSPLSLFCPSLLSAVPGKEIMCHWGIPFQ